MRSSTLKQGKPIELLQVKPYLALKHSWHANDIVEQGVTNFDPGQPIWRTSYGNINI